MIKINKYDIWLSSINGVGSFTYNKILKHFNTSENVWNSSKKELEELKIKKEIVDKILNKPEIDVAESILEKMHKQNIHTINILDSEYPDRLKRVRNAPINLYAKGNLELLKNFSLGIVGSRNCSIYGEKVATNLSRALSEKNITIISGLAMGIDTYAHKGALKNVGGTIAVLGSGFDNVYPQENKKLFEEIINNNGLVITEYLPEVIPALGNFPSRNRIVSGLSAGIIVVEAKEKSGALITANIAKKENKPVFAIPGNINSFHSKGSNQIIKEGAKLVTNLNDILEEFEELKDLTTSEIEVKTKERTLEKIPKEYREVYKLILGGDESIEQIKNKLPNKVSDINSILTMLELEGYIESVPGNRFIIK